ncbi:MAG: T9SS type A sorting domain-containing protein [Saprospiraceae bacterium]|nr:T9SS type A sorting domain-containing protein [Candidatus Vicinibacter affinis]MBK9961668.1 T9SS type A sorting domain-containing protein [Candidatus Vicinibacter affinis]
MYKITLIIGFICFNCLVFNFIYSQSPGGVDHPLVWKQFYSSDSRASNSTETFNYNKYLKLEGNKNDLNIPIGNLNKFSLFVVFNSKNNENIASIYSENNEIIITDSSVNSRNKYAYKNTHTKPKILSFVESTKKLKNLDTNGIIKINQKSIVISESFQGGIAEIIVYDKLLNRKQINKIESYLAIKYGISLPLTSNYYNSNGGIIWDPLQHKGFEHNLTSIGKDKNTNLNQLQSRNEYSDVNLTIGLNQIATCNNDNKSTILNNSYLFWSDNNKSSIFKRKDENSDNLSVERIWQIVHNGDLGKGEGLEFNIKLKDSLPNPINNTLWLVYNKNSLGNLSGVNKDAIKVKLQLEENNSYKGIINEKFNSCDFYFTFIWGPKINMELYPDVENCSKILTNAILEINDLHEDIAIYLNGKEVTTNRKDLAGKMSISLENIPYFNNTLKLIVNQRDTLYKFFNIDKSTCRNKYILQEIEITVSPNPIRAGYYFEIFVKGLEDGPVNFNIYSEQMKFVKSLISHSVNGVVSVKEKLNTSGVYILEIIQEKASKSSKIIVIN